MPEVELEDGEVLVEKKVVPRKRDRTGPWAVLLVLVFAVTYGLVVFSGRVGLGPDIRPPHSAVSTTSPTVPD